MKGKEKGIQMFGSLGSLGSLGQNFSLSSLAASQGLKKNLEEKVQEKNQIFGYIGMEVCDLCQEGKLTVPQLDVYFEKLNEVEREIKELEAKLAETKQKNQTGGRCSCGCSLKPGVKFCPQCGKPAGPEVLLCSCGQKIEKGVQFCQNCGKKVSEPAADTGSEWQDADTGNERQDADTGQITAEVQGQEKECICGARIPAGETMCMACGRLVM